MAPKKIIIGDLGTSYPVGTILSGKSGNPITFTDFLEALSRVRVVYVGESHKNASHHAIQLQILQSLFQQNPGLCVGMEMFDRSYQEVLDAWSAGDLDEALFLQQTHWYANWKYDYSLYRDIMNFIKNNKIPLVGLNIPFHLPAKISIGGIQSLHPEERRFLPDKIDNSNATHRAFVEEIFKSHRIPGRDNFEYFYEAQCVWEDTMAEQIASNLGSKNMIVLAGNGHIIKKVGIPNRVFDKTSLPFQTVYLASAAGQAEASYGDFLWITP